MKELFSALLTFIEGTLRYIEECLNTIYTNPYAGAICGVILIVALLAIILHTMRKKSKHQTTDLDDECALTADAVLSGRPVKETSPLGQILYRLWYKLIEEIIYILSAFAMMGLRAIEVIQSYIVVMLDYFSGRMQNKTISKLMVLAILTLSVTSFFTTYSGMESLVADSSIRLLLVFGIQAILFAASIKIGEGISRASVENTRLIGKKTDAMYIVLFVVTLCISSFFSYNYFLDTLYRDQARYMDNFNKIKDIAYEILIDADAKVPKSSNTDTKKEVTDYLDDLLSMINSSEFGRETFAIYDHKNEYDSLNQLIDDINSAKSKDEIISELEGLIVEYERGISQNNALIIDLNSKLTSDAIGETYGNAAALKAQISSLQSDIASKQAEITKLRQRIDEITASQNIEESVEERKTAFKEATGYNLEEYESLLKGIDEKVAKLNNKSAIAAKITSLANSVNSDEFDADGADGDIVAIKQYISEFDSESTRALIRQYPEMEAKYKALKDYNTYTTLKEQNINALDEINIDFGMAMTDEEARNLYIEKTEKLLSLVTETIIKAPTQDEGAQTGISGTDMAYKHRQLSRMRTAVRNAEPDLHPIEKNYRAASTNILLTLTSLFLAVIIDCSILFTGILIPRSSSMMSSFDGIGPYNSEERENMLRSMFTHPVKGNRKNRKEDKNEG